MRTALLRLFRQSPFEGLLRHADYIRQSGPIFQLALIAYLDENPEEFEKHHNQVTILEHQGDLVKRNIRGHLPRGILMPMDKFQLIWYLREQDKILDSVQDALHWLSYRKTDIPDEMVDDLLLLVEKVNEVLKAVYPLVSSAESYFSNFSEQQREKLKQEIRLIREFEFESDQVERELLSKILAYPFENSTSAFHLARLVEYMGNVANHAENAGDMMRAMIAR